MAEFDVTDCFASVNYLEIRGTPFAVAVNCFNREPHHDPAEIRLAFYLGLDVPVRACDAREAAPVKQALITVLETISAISASRFRLVRQ